jgi:hypothetical protein
MAEKSLSRTTSLCPTCLRTLPAEIFERKERVWIRKRCPRHGLVEDLYWGDYRMWQSARRWAHDGKGISNPNIKELNGCPRNCGLCGRHISHTALANIVVTNRCNLNCWYCFFSHKNLLKLGYVYEPSLEQIARMLKILRAQRPVPPNALQLTGGEPALRSDILDIIKLARTAGFDHVQLNTNGIRLATEPGFAKAVRAAGVNTIYLSFDGTTPKTNPKNHREIPAALAECRRAGIGIVLVPTVIRAVNDHDIGGILRFGLKNIDVVRGINYQPVSFVGRVSKAERRRFRITIPDIIEALETQTGLVTADDFYPVPTVTALTHLIEALSGKPEYELTAHPHCGMATYLFLDGRKVIPLPRFVDVDGLMEYLSEMAKDLKHGKSKTLAILKILASIGRYIDKSKQPKGLNLLKLLAAILRKHDYSALGQLHHKSLFIGMMHFMDLYNYDIERVKRCCIHYAVPDGRVLPFCTFNVIPKIYRDRIQKKYSMSLAQWEKKTGRKLSDDLHV